MFNAICNTQGKEQPPYSFPNAVIENPGKGKYPRPGCLLAIRGLGKHGMCGNDKIEIVQTEKKMYFLPML